MVETIAQAIIQPAMYRDGLNRVTITLLGIWPKMYLV